ncbi:hypothetical protein HK096_011063 [Nowakowskiella sp. JEL0078]|nr:hypothetical protein HK096_011063 [Nowakowskiella sp. JEL0078]
MCFVRPTTQMLIRPNKHVDLNGKIFHPYLFYWPSKTESTIVEFLRILQDIFASEPPVYSRSAPSASTMYTSHNQSQSNSSTSSPRLGSNPPPVPPPPSRQETQWTSPTLTSSIVSAGSSIASAITRNLNSPVSFPFSQPTTNIPPQTQILSKLSVTRNLVLEKLQGEMFQYNTKVGATSDIDLVLASTRQLEQGDLQINEILRKLNIEKSKVINNIEILQSKNRELVESIESIKSQPDANVDEAITGGTVLNNQLLDVVAEDHAIDDTIQMLFEALDKHDTELAIFLKHVRSLAREQFMKRALIKKIQSQI